MSKKLYPEEDIQNIANAIRTLNGSSDTYTVSEMASAIALPENGYYLKESVSANPLSITDGEELKCQSALVTFAPKQSGTGDPSPSNIRPISGWDSLNLRRCDRIITNLIRGGVQDGNGQDSVSTKRLRTDYIEFDGNPLSVALQNGQTNERFRSIHFYDTNKTYLGYASIPNTLAKLSKNIPANARYFKLVLMLSTDIDLTLENEFISYNRGIESFYDEYTATFPETVYGGSYDFVSGTGESDMGIVDMGDLNWAYENNVFNVTISDKADTYLMYCSVYKPTNKSRSELENGELGIYSTGTMKRIAIRDNNYTTTDDFKTAVNGQTLCYELATPQEITLTPEDIELLKGSNTVWTDGDTVQIKYFSKSLN